MKNSPSLSSCILPRFVLHGTELWVGFSSAEWFGTEFREFASIFVLRNGIPSDFLFRLRVWNEIPRVCCYFYSTERNSELFSLPRKGSERNSERFCSAEQPEFRRKEPFVPSIPPSAELFFCRKFPTLLPYCTFRHATNCHSVLPFKRYRPDR